MEDVKKIIVFKKWIIFNDQTIRNQIYDLIPKKVEVSFLGYFTESSYECGRGPQINYKTIDEVVEDKSIIRLDDLYYIFSITHDNQSHRFNAKIYIYNNNIFFRFSLNTVQQEEKLITNEHLNSEDFNGVSLVIGKFLNKTT